MSQEQTNSDSPPPVAPLKYPEDLPTPASIGDLYAHSVAVAERARGVVPNRAQPIFDLATVHRDFGYDEKAVAVYREGLALEPAHPSILTTIGFILSQRNDRMEEAREAYQAALALDPRLPGARTRIGLIDAHQGRIDEATRQYQAEIHNQSASADTFYLLGQACLLKKQHADAVAAFKQCLELNPDHENAWYGMFQGHRALGQPAEAEQAMAKFRQQKEKARQKVEEGPKEKSSRQQQLRFTAAIYEKVATTYDSVGRAGEARFCMEAALLFDPLSLEANLTLAERYRQEGETDIALQHCERALEGTPKFPEALYLLSGLCQERGQTERSGELLLELIDVEPENPNAHRELAKLILSGKLRLGDAPTRGLDYAERAVKLARSSMNLDVYAFALFANGRLEEALEALKEAVRLDPKNREVKKRLETLVRSLSESRPR